MEKLYVVVYDGGAEDSHAYHDLVKAEDVDEAIDKWRGCRFGGGRRLIGIVPVKKQLAAAYADDNNLSAWFDSNDAIQEIANTVAIATGSWEVK